jgi:photosystem II Psb28-2 protein
MTSSRAIIYFFEGIPEEISNVSLRRNRRTGVGSVLLSFKQVRALERFNSFTKKFTNSLCLTDEGEIRATPSSVKFIFGEPEGDEFHRINCAVEIEQEDHWERFMQFMNRYAQANGMEYQE